MEYVRSIELEQRIVKWIIFSFVASFAPLVIYWFAYALPAFARSPAKSFDFNELLERGDSFVITLTLLFASAGDLVAKKRSKSVVADYLVPFVVISALLVAASAVFYVEFCHRMHETIPSNQLLGFSMASLFGVLIIGTVCATVSTE